MFKDLFDDVGLVLIITVISKFLPVLFGVGIRGSDNPEFCGIHFSREGKLFSAKNISCSSYPLSIWREFKYFRLI
jgi:hypothetical protein